MGTPHAPGPRRRTSRDRLGGGLRPVFHDHSRADKTDYKTAALCKQVRRILGMVLAGECGDPLLQSLLVEDVLPAPSAGRLLVRLLLPEGAGGGVIECLQRLELVEGLLRARIAETIARKRTPELAFEIVPFHSHVVPPPAGEEEGHD
jgi:ribosome-binding factor A